MTTPPIQPDPLPADDVITPDDVERAKAAFEAAQLPQDRRLLDATAVPEEPTQ